MNSLQGQLLIASPKLLDPNFFRTIILIVQHGENGALGVVLNRPLETSIKSAWGQISETPCDSEELIYQGGPCDGPLMVIHTNEELGQVEVMPGIHFSTERDSVQKLGTDADSLMRFFVGYSGWANGQLEGEIEHGSWLTTGATRDQIFAEVEGQWEELFKVVSRATAFPWLDPRFIPKDPTTN